MQWFLSLRSTPQVPSARPERRASEPSPFPLERDARLAFDAVVAPTFATNVAGRAIRASRPSRPAWRPNRPAVGEGDGECVEGQPAGGPGHEPGRGWQRLGWVSATSGCWSPPPLAVVAVALVVVLAGQRWPTPDRTGRSEATAGALSSWPDGQAELPPSGSGPSPHGVVRRRRLLQNVPRPHDQVGLPVCVGWNQVRGGGLEDDPAAVVGERDAGQTLVG